MISSADPFFSSRSSIRPSIEVIAIYVYDIPSPDARGGVARDIIALSGMLNRVKRRLQEPYDYLVFRVEALRLGLQERKQTSDNGAVVPVPPPLLRHRVHGGFDLDGYLHVGRICAQSLRDLLKSVGRDPSSFGKILDFGCGSGRTLRSFDDLPDS